MKKSVLLALVLCAVAQALDSGDNKFMKDYAMLKIYESCFGTALLKQIAKELKDAYAKCSTAPPVKEQMNPVNRILLNRLPPGFTMDPNTQTITKPGDGAINNNQENILNQEMPQQPQKTPVVVFAPNEGPLPQQLPFPSPWAPQLRPYGAQYPSPYYRWNPQGEPVPYAAYNPYFPNYQQGYYPQPQPYYPNNRMSRQLSLRTRLGLNIPRAPNAHNVTCVMQELGYIDQNLEPNYEQITNRISNLPVSQELKADIQEGLNFCQKFSQCVPEDKRDIVPRPQEQIKAIFFFRCYKHKKLEACIMKDINEHFTKDYVIDTEAEFGTFSRSGRSAREVPFRDPSMEALEEMEVYLYDYLSGAGPFDFDLYL